MGQAKMMNGSIVIPAKNGGGQDLFVGVFCDKKLFNFTGSGFRWGDWQRPVYSMKSRLSSMPAVDRPVDGLSTASFFLVYSLLCLQ